MTVAQKRSFLHTADILAKKEKELRRNK